MRKFALCLALLSSLGCSASCLTTKVKELPHPTLPAPAKALEFKCGDKTVVLELEEGIPPCMTGCFDGR